MNKFVFSCMLVSFPLSCMDEQNKKMVWFTRLLHAALLTLFSCLSLLVRGGWWWVPLQCLWVDVPLEEGREIVFLVTVGKLCAVCVCVCVCVCVFQCVCVTQSPRSHLTPSPGHRGHSIHKPGLEENVCVIEHTVLQRNNDELRTTKMAPQHLTDILRSGQRERRSL